jgi:mono/diheme cytochrome c family protein
MRLFLVTAALALVAASVRAETGDGATLFAHNCALCHQSGAVGLAGQFPRLAGRVGPISAKASGRAYLIGVLTYGLAGQITVDKQPIIGVMPPFAALPDQEVAAILTYLQGLGDAPKQPFSAEEVGMGRGGAARTAADMMGERQKLAAAKVIE